MQKISADKMTIMECDPESTQYIINALTMELWEKSVVWKLLYKTIYHGVQKIS